MHIENLNSAESLAKVVAIARDIISATKSTQELVKSIRDMTFFIHKTASPCDEIFNQIVGFEAETHDYPVGKPRERYAAEFLKRLDEDMEMYIRKNHSFLITSCKEIIVKYGSKEQQ